MRVGVSDSGMTGAGLSELECGVNIGGVCCTIDIALVMWDAITHPVIRSRAAEPVEPRAGIRNRYAFDARSTSGGRSGADNARLIVSKSVFSY